MKIVIDARMYGLENAGIGRYLINLLNELEKIPNTLTVVTGKGKHLYFRYPNEEVTTKRGIIEGVDVRGDGGYVAGVGSNHISGMVYSFNNPLEEIAEAPQFILDLVLKSKQVRKSQAMDILSTQVPFLNSNNDGWSIEDARDMLGHISADVGYDEWIAVGMAIHSEGLPFSLWDDWSKTSGKYDNTTVNHWKSFNPGRGVSFGTVVHMAQEGGWKKERWNEYYQQHMGSEVPDIEPGEDIGENTCIVVEDPGLLVEDNKVSTGSDTKLRTIQYIHSDDIKPSIECNAFIQSVMGERQMSVIYGPSNCGKTFFMTDLAFHVALGREWRDKRVDQGTIIYVALEGAHGLINRIAAFKQENMLTESMPFIVVPSPIDFMNPEGNIDEFIEVIKEIEDQNGGVKLIVIDTLARALMGGDENSGQDMGTLIMHSDKIRAHTDAHISFVHHSGKDELKGARGHSSLRAAVDTEIEIRREKDANYSTISIVKQREMEMIDDMYFSLKQVLLGTNQYDEEVTSCIVLPISEPELVSKVVRLSSSEEFVYDSLVAAIDKVGIIKRVPGGTEKLCVDYFQLTQEMELRGSHKLFKEVTSPDEDDADAIVEDKEKNANTVKKATNVARKGLKQKGKVNFDRNYIWLIGVNEIERM